MKDILKFFTIFTTRQKKEFLALFIIMLVGAVFEAVGIGAILPLVSLLEKPNFLSDNPGIALFVRTFGITDHREFILFSIVGLILLYLAKNIYISVSLFIQRRYAMKMQCLYAEEIFLTYLAKPYEFHVNNNTAKLLRDVNAVAGVIFNNILMPIFSLTSELITALAIWFMLLVVDYVTAVVVAFIMIVIVLVIIYSFRNKIVEQGRAQNDASVEYLKWINQGLGAIKETKILGKESYFISKFADSYKKYAGATQIYLFLLDIPRIIIEFIVIVGLLFLILFKIFLGEVPADVVPVLGVLAMASFRLMPSANRIVSSYNSIKNQMPFFYEMYDVLLETKNRLVTGKSVITSGKRCRMIFSDKLHVDNVSFRYTKDSKLILDGVSFDIKKGSFIGIIGTSGAGKTTLVDILLGLLNPENGSIFCDNFNREDNIRTWQALFAYVPQEIYLTDGSIRENIALGESEEDIDDNLLNRVLDMAELSNYVNSLPDGVDTFVGERGVKLSGGQRQRIGIARALYQQPEILILDEATSALDNETEKAITDTILKFKGKITIIAIAHRVSTLEACDYKIRIENGKTNIVQ